MGFRQGQETAPIYQVRQSVRDGEWKVWKGDITQGDNPVRTFENKRDAVQQAKQFAGNNKARGVVVFERDSLSSQAREYVDNVIAGAGAPRDPAGTLEVQPYHSNTFQTGLSRASSDGFEVQEEGKDGYLNIGKTHRHATEIAEEIAQGLNFAKVRRKMPNRSAKVVWEA